MESAGNVLGVTGQVGRIANRNKNRDDSVTQAAMRIGPLSDKI